MENKIRSTLNEIYFGKTKDIVNGLRYHYMSCLDTSSFSALPVIRICRICFSNCSQSQFISVTPSVHLVFSYLFFICHFMILFKPVFTALLFSCLFPLYPLATFFFYFLPFLSDFCCCSFSSLCLSFLIPSFNPSICLPPCAPDLLSLCLITKSTGSSRRSCRRSSPSVRSSLTRVRGTTWHVELCVFAC